LSVKCDDLVCRACRCTFAIEFGRPILFRQDNELFPPHAYIGHSGPRERRVGGVASLIPSPSVNLSYRRNLAFLCARLSERAPERVRNVLVVGCGKQRAWLDQFMKRSKSTRMIYCDVDSNADADLYCDAHTLPFRSGVFDAVITTAVLEHVLRPNLAADEITRVTSAEGLIYSEFPFMQQVHEGAYDFTRFTLSGHRLLFRQFRELDSGLIAGPATSLTWALENLAVCFGPTNGTRNAIRAVVRLTFFWLKYLDYFLKKNPIAIDGASCTYFVGVLEPGYLLSDRLAVESYRGARLHSHLHMNE